MSDVERVESYDDLASDADLADEDVDAIARALQKWGGHSHELVFWVPDWLVEEKDLDESRDLGSPRVYTGICDNETDKAWCWKNKGAGDNVWLPKSQVRAFRRSHDSGSFAVPRGDRR